MKHLYVLCDKCKPHMYPVRTVLGFHHFLYTEDTAKALLTPPIALKKAAIGGECMTDSFISVSITALNFDSYCSLKSVNSVPLMAKLLFQKKSGNKFY